MVASGLRSLVFYFSMGRYMVGGKSLLFHGIIRLDLGMLAYSISNEEKYYVLLYLIGYHAFSGAIDLMHSMEARKLDAPWRRTALQGILSLLRGY